MASNLLRQVPVDAPSVNLLTAVYRWHRFAVHVRFSTSDRGSPLGVCNRFGMGPGRLRRLTRLVEFDSAPGGRSRNLPRDRKYGKPGCMTIARFDLCSIRHSDRVSRNNSCPLYFSCRPQLQPYRPNNFNDNGSRNVNPEN